MTFLGSFAEKRSENQSSNTDYKIEYDRRLNYNKFISKTIDGQIEVQSLGTHTKTAVRAESSDEDQNFLSGFDEEELNQIEGNILLYATETITEVKSEAADRDVNNELFFATETFTKTIGEGADRD